MSFSNFLTSLRENAGLTRTALAKKLGVSLTYMASLESHSGFKRKPPTVERLEQIASALVLPKKDKETLLSLAFQERNKKELSAFKKVSVDIPLVSVDSLKLVSVPVLSRCPASAKVWVSSEIDSYEQLPKTYINGRRMFILKIQGDSMNRAGIDSGDMVIVDTDREPKNGNIVVARVDDECTVKRFYKADNTITLSPDSTNPEHSPMIFSKANKIVIHGVVDSLYLKRLK